MARGHVDISERRLRPIYDALDNGNNKKALQEADKALKKQKDLLCAKALRGLALLRLGRMEECLMQISEVHTSSPTDEPTLQAMSISYREMHKLDRIADLYENANKAQPDNEELLSSLFMAYVRIHNYKKQQQVAMKLHKLQPHKNPYYFWAVMSIVMQAQEDPKLGQMMFLPLAERMTEKYAKEERIEAEAEVYLYLLVLDNLKKYDKAWEVVTGSLGQKLQSELDFKEVKGTELLLKMEKWPEANVALKKLLMKNPDLWQFYKDYFSSLFHLIDSGYTSPLNASPKENGNSSDQNNASNNKDANSESKMVNGDCDGSTNDTETENKSETDDKSQTETKEDYTLEMAVEFLGKQLELTKSQERPLRGPYLAMLELHKCLAERNKGETLGDTGKVLEAMEQYYEVFGDKPCCVSDLGPYLTLLGNQQQQFIRKHMEKSFPLGADGELALPEDAKSIQRHINLMAMSRMSEIHANMSVEQKLDLVKELDKRYHHGLQFGEHLLKTDPQYSDTYILLAAHTLHDLWVETGEQEHLWRALALLEKSLLKSPSNFQTKLLLIKLYCLMGAFGPCPNLYDGMEIKHIQNDSLGYIITNHIGQLGHISACCSLYETMLRFFSINHKETTEYLVQSYKYGSFTKIIDFVKFRERLKNSFQYASAKTERMLIDLTMESSITRHENTEQMVAYLDINPEQLETCGFEEMVDNRDLTVMTAWDPPSNTLTDKWKQYSFKEEKLWLAVRNLVMRTVCQAVVVGQVTARQQHKNNNTIDNSEQEATSSVRKVFENLKRELQEKLDECKTYVSQPQYPLAGPSKTRLGSYLGQGFGDLYMQLCDMFSNLHTMVDSKHETLEKIFEDTLQSLKEKYSASMSKSCRDVFTEVDGKKTFYQDVLESLVLLTEFTSQASVFVGSCYRMIKPVKVLHTKKSKKKKSQEQVTQTQEPVALFQFYEAFLCSIEEQTEVLSAQFKTMDDKLAALNFNQAQDASEDDDFLENVQRQVVVSYRASAQQMSTLLQNKLQYLSVLKL